MPELLIPLFFSYLFYLYLTMKKPKTATEKLPPKAATEQPVAEAKPKKPSPVPKPVKQKETVAKNPAPKVKAKESVAIVASEIKPKKASPSQKTPTIAKTPEPKPEKIAVEIAMSERVGLTAGTIWQFLAKNGATPVNKLVKELPEEEKIIQRSIGWLAQEGKISLNTIDKIETISLTG
jgi:hypothetical protein